MGLLGFQDWQCLAAMAHACGDLQEALVLLLEGRLDTPGQAEALLLRSHAQAVRDRAGEQLDAMQALQVRGQSGGACAGWWTGDGGSVPGLPQSRSGWPLARITLSCRAPALASASAPSRSACRLASAAYYWATAWASNHGWAHL